MDTPSEAIVMSQLTWLNRVHCSPVPNEDTKRLKERRLNQLLGWFEEYDIPLKIEQEHYVLMNPYKVTLWRIHERMPFDYGELARHAGVDFGIVYKMIVSDPVAKEDAIKVLIHLKDIVDGGPYNLETVNVKLLPE